jgi:plasmid stabilization system protein ParE
MEYRVVLADSAKADAEILYHWVIERAPLRGPEWFERLLDCLYSLNNSPGRCPLAPEARRSHRAIRNLLDGKRRNVYRILFEIDEERHTVWVLHIRRGARAPLGPEELAEPDEC